jgi:hypothetical protein
MISLHIQPIPPPPEGAIEVWVIYVFAIVILALFGFMTKLVFIIIGLVKDNTRTNTERNEIDRTLTHSITKNNDLITQALAKGLRKNDN